MRKVFLCHSSQDKDYVRIVATRLRRAKVVFDEMSFEPGHDFREQILKGLDTSALFVFIVSKASLTSMWCKFELDQAQLKRMAGAIEATLCIIKDYDVSFSDLPKWLQVTKAVIQPRPSQATRDIQHALFSILTPQLERPFVGRQPLQEDFASAMANLSASPPRILVASGLEGIGRRSYLERVVRDGLQSTKSGSRLTIATSHPHPTRADFTPILHPESFSGRGSRSLPPCPTRPPSLLERSALNV
jgi:hypothetical protein